MLMREFVDWVFSPVVFEVGALFALAIGVSMALATASHDIKKAHWFFAVGFILTIGRVGQFVANMTTSPALKYGVTFFIFGLVGVLWVGTHDWVLKKYAHSAESSAPTNPPANPPRSDTSPPIERAVNFAAMIPFDTAPNSAPIPLDENPDDPLFRAYSDMASLATYGTVPNAVRATKDEGQITWTSAPVSAVEAPAFLGKLLQYYVFVCIDTLQRDSLTLSLGYPAQANAGIEIPDAEPYPYEKIFRELSNNVFFRPFLHRPPVKEMLWKLKPIKMPKGTEIKFTQMDKPDRYVVSLERYGYFKADFLVEGYGLATGVGQVPKYFKTSHADTTMQWPFKVKMQYTVEHPEDNQFNPGIYSQWLDGLYDGLNKKLAAAY